MKYTMKDFVERCIAVRVRNKQEKEAFLKMCEAHGLKWRTGLMPTMGLFHNPFGDALCISCDFGPGDENKISYADVKLYREHGWTVVNFSDIVQEGKKDDYYILIACQDGKTTTAKLLRGSNFDDLRVVKSAEAKRNPADKFNLRLGAQTAFDRLWERSAK